MINESRYWKGPLLDTARWLKRLSLGKGTQERTYVRIEKEIFLSFYSIRKLIESKKVEDQVASSFYPIISHPNINPVNRLNRYEIEELYDLSDKRVISRDLYFICNQFIHSYIFSIYENKSRLGGFWVSSDRTKNQLLFFVSRDQIIQMLTAVGSNYPETVIYKYNLNSKEYDVSFDELRIKPRR